MCLGNSECSLVSCAPGISLAPDFGGGGGVDVGGDNTSGTDRGASVGGAERW
jgi:hypothetical protein